MKKFNLASLGFALCTIYNNNTITQEGKLIHANDKGMVQLKATDKVTIGKKDYKKDAIVPVKLTDVFTWAEPTDWVDATEEEVESIKGEIKTMRKTLEGTLSTATAEMLKAFGKPEFTDLAAQVNNANIALEKFNALHPATKGAGGKPRAPKADRVYTLEEQKAIAAYNEAIAAHTAAVAAVAVAKEAIATAKAALPTDYKAKGAGRGTRDTSAGTPPKADEKIRAAMYHDYTVGAMKMPKIAEKYGYSNSYCSFLLKGSKKKPEVAVETKKMYDTMGSKPAADYSASYVLVLS